MSEKVLGFKGNKDYLVNNLTKRSGLKKGTLYDFGRWGLENPETIFGSVINDLIFYEEVPVVSVEEFVNKCKEWHNRIDADATLKEGDKLNRHWSIQHLEDDLLSAIRNQSQVKKK